MFEFYTASIGLAGLVGARVRRSARSSASRTCPFHWWALGLLFLSAFGYRDRRAGRWSRGLDGHRDASRLVAGSSGSSTAVRRELRPPWWVFLVVIGGMVLFMLGGMTAMIRARFSTPTVGREGMIGENGVAEVAVDPDGVVLIRGARWRARTNRATPIQAGEPSARGRAVEGLVLEVEPPEGGAQDYRDAGPSAGGSKSQDSRLRPLVSPRERSE